MHLNLLDLDLRQVAKVISIAHKIAWAGADDGPLPAQVNVDHSTLTDLRCALTAIGVGRDLK